MLSKKEMKNMELARYCGSDCFYECIIELYHRETKYMSICVYKNMCKHIHLNMSVMTHAYSTQIIL